MMLRELLPLSLIILIAGLGFLVWHYRYGLKLTFSQQAALDDFGILYYITLFTIVCPLLYIFFTSWFAPMLALPPSFSVFVSTHSCCNLSARCYLNGAGP